MHHLRHTPKEAAPQRRPPEWPVMSRMA